MDLSSIRRRIPLVLGLLLALGLAAPSVQAEPLTPSELGALAAGGTVVRQQTIETDSRRFVGGITYTVLDTTPAELSAVLEDVNAYRRLFPRTKAARRVAPPEGARASADEFFIELRQGTSLYEATYTLRTRRDPSGRYFRFWLDPTRPHAIDDAWGFFRIEPIPGETPRVLLTYGVLVDMGPGLIRELFEERLRAAMLRVPNLVGEYLADLHAFQPVRAAYRPAR
jgi:hypothetical protein